MAAPGGPPRFWSALADLIRLRNQTGSLLLLFPTLWALVLAGDGHPPPFLTAVFIAGVFVMRSAGVAINDWWDRDLDRLVQRTRERPLAAGLLHPRAAIGVFVALIGIAAALVSLLNPLTIALAPLALLLALLYPLAKRVMPLPQAVLGIAFGWGAVMAWAAVRNEIGWPALGLFVATICWAVGYDTIYALQDIEDDRRIGVRSSAIFFGEQCWIAVSGALFAMLQASLGLSFDYPTETIRLHHPCLPQLLDDIVIRNIAIGGTRMDLMLHRHGAEVAVNVIAKHGGGRVEIAL